MFFSNLNEICITIVHAAQKNNYKRIIRRNITELIKKETAPSNITHGAQLNIELR